MIQLSFNAKESKIIKTTSFFVNYKRESNLFNYQQSSMLIKIAKNKVEILKKIHENILEMQHKFAIQINKKRKKAS